MVRIPFNHPAHSFEQVDFPPTPSATGELLHHYRCTKCGVIGIRERAGVFLHVNGRCTQPHRARMCCDTDAAFQSKLVRVTTDRIDGLAAGSALPLALPPEGQPLLEEEGVWVYRPDASEPVMLTAYDFSPLVVRKRTRCASPQAPAAKVA